MIHFFFFFSYFEMKQGYIAYFWVSGFKPGFLTIFTSPDKTKWAGNKSNWAFYSVYLVKKCSYERLFRMNLKRIIIYLPRVFLTLIIAVVFANLSFFLKNLKIYLLWMFEGWYLLKYTSHESRLRCNRRRILCWFQL